MAEQDKDTKSAAENLRVQQAINETLKQRLVSLGRIINQEQSSLRFAKELQSVFESIDLSDIGDGVADAASSVQEMKNATADAASKARDSMSGFQDLSGLLSGDVSKAFAGLESAGSGAGDALDVTSFSVSDLATEGALMATGIGEAQIALGATTKISELLTGAITGTAGAIYSLTKNILSIPLGIFSFLQKEAANFVGDNSFARALENIREKFGSFKESISKNIITSFKNASQGLQQAGLSAYKVFEDRAAMLEYFGELFEKAGAQALLFGSEIARTSGQVTVFEKGMGLGGEQLRGFMERSAVYGRSLNDELTEAGNLSIQVGKAFNVPSKILSRDIGAMVKDVTKFGSLTKKEMATAAIYTKKLGLEIEALNGLIDKFDDFETAAESASNLSQAFGASVDAFQLMQEQNPAKRLDELRKAFLQTGRSVESMSRQELNLLAQTSGLTSEQAKLAFSAKNMGVSYNEITKQSDKANDSQLSQVEVLKQLSDNVKRIVRDGQQLKEGFFDNLLNGILAGIRWSAPFQKVMQSFRSVMWETYNAGVKLGGALANFFDRFISSAGNADSSIVGLKSFIKNIQGIQRSLLVVINGFTSVLNSTGPEGFSIGGFLTKLFNPEQGSEMDGALSSIKASVLDIAKTYVPMAFGIVADVLGQVVDIVSAGAGGILGKQENGEKSFFSEIISAFGQGIFGEEGYKKNSDGSIAVDPKSLFGKLSTIWTQIKKLFGEVVDKVLPILGNTLGDAFGSLAGKLVKFLKEFNKPNGPASKAANGSKSQSAPGFFDSFMKSFLEGMKKEGTDPKELKEQILITLGDGAKWLWKNAIAPALEWFAKEGMIQFLKLSVRGSLAVATLGLSEVAMFLWDKLFGGDKKDGKSSPGLLAKATNWVTGAVSFIRNAVSDAFKGVTKMLGGFLNTATEPLRNVINPESIISSILPNTGAIGAVKNAASSFLSGTDKAFEDAELKRRQMMAKYYKSKQEESAMSSPSPTLDTSRINELESQRLSIEEKMKGITALANSGVLEKASGILDGLSGQLANFSQRFQVAGALNVLGQTSALVTSMNQINEVLGSGELGGQVVTKLKKISEGLGSKNSYEIKNKGITIKLDLKVTMDAGKVEEAIIFRKESIIRDAIDESLDNINSVKDSYSVKEKLRQFRTL